LFYAHIISYNLNIIDMLNQTKILINDQKLII
jgi:hypothetical protein